MMTPTPPDAAAPGAARPLAPALDPDPDSDPDQAPALRIGIACYPLIGGSGILASALGTELARRGHEVHFFSYAPPVRLDLAAPRIYFHEVTVNQYSLFRYPDYTLPLATRMAEVAGRRRLAILHVHYAVPHATAAYLAAQMLGPARAPALVTTLHGTDTTLLGRDPSYRPAIEHALAHSDAVTAVSAHLRGETAAVFGLPEAAVDVVPNFYVPTGAARGRAEVRRELGVSEEEFLVVHTSNLRPVKRVDLLLRSFALAVRQEKPGGRRLRLVILAGEDFGPYEPTVAELGLGGRVVSRRGAAAVEDYLEAADAGLYTSESESFGLSILETLFAGRPVVAFRVGGIPEVMVEGVTGFLPPFGDVAAAAAALHRLAGAPELADRLGAQARRHAQEHFTADRVVPCYEAIYRRVDAARRRG